VTLALVILPLMVVAGSISSETQPELAKQAFVDKAYWEAIRICCNSEIGGFVMRMDCPLDGIGGATERSPTDPALGANSKVTGKSSIDVQMMNYRHWAFEWKAPGDSAGAGCLSCGGAGGGAGDGTRLWWGRVHRFREATQARSCATPPWASAATCASWTPPASPPWSPPTPSRPSSRALTAASGPSA